VVEVNSINICVFNEIHFWRRWYKVVYRPGLEMAHRVAVEKGRASLQAATVERLGPPGGGSEVPVWLFIVEHGHIRAYSQEEIRGAVDVTAMSTTDVTSIETREERMRIVGLRFRLIQTSIVPERRLRIPSEAFDLCAEYIDRTHVWFDLTTHVDIFTATYVQTLLGEPLSKFLPKTY
jgi:hypothetical protein